MKKYYEQGGFTIYHGDNLPIMLELVGEAKSKMDLLLTDPNYGISRDGGMRGAGHDGFGNGTKRADTARVYEGDWDDERASNEQLHVAIALAQQAIIWGGNYFADLLPVSTKWLVWDKQQTMPTYSDAELAWTNLPGVSTKMFRYNGSGLMAKERTRFHPTQKPESLILWCLGLVPEAKTVIDPWLGSGTTLVAAKLKGMTGIGIEKDERFCEVAAKRLAQDVLIPH